MKSETGPEQVRPARVLSPCRSIVRFSLVVQDSTHRQATARRHRASTALQAVCDCVELRESRASVEEVSRFRFDAGSARAQQNTPRWIRAISARVLVREYRAWGAPLACRGRLAIALRGVSCARDSIHTLGCFAKIAC
eukprot:6713388-Prymnesium_polylepis.1